MSLKASEGFKGVSMRPALLEYIAKFIEEHQELGYKSVADFVQEAVRLRIQELQKLYPKFKEKTKTLPPNLTRKRIKKGLKNISATRGSRLSREERIEIVLGRSDIFVFSLIVILICSVVVFFVCFSVGFAHGRSMFPALRDGDFLLFSKTFDPENLSIGFIILYYSHATNTSVCHRIINAGTDSKGKFYVTKGDYDSEPDVDPVRPSQILGVLVFNQSPYLFYLEIFLGINFVFLIAYAGVKKLKRIFKEISDRDLKLSALPNINKQPQKPLQKVNR